MRKLVIGLLVLLLLLGVADRVAVRIAQEQVAKKLRETGQLSEDPQVTIRGFPFLTQALAGRYDRIDVETKAFTRGGVVLSKLDVSLIGARVPAGDALGGTVRSVPVEGLRATAVVRYVDLAGKSGISGLRIVPVGEQLDISARVTVAGQTVTATARSTVRLRGRTLVVSARSVKVDGQSSPVLDRALAGRLDFTVPLGTLPYGLDLTAVRVDPSGVVLVAASGPTVLTTR
jgi:hypothetical protein